MTFGNMSAEGADATPSDQGVQCLPRPALLLEPIVSPSILGALAVGVWSAPQENLAEKIMAQVNSPRDPLTRSASGSLVPDAQSVPGAKAKARWKAAGISVINTHRTLKANVDTQDLSVSAYLAKPDRRNSDPASLDAADAKVDISELLKTYYNADMADDNVDMQDMWRREAIRFDPAVVAALKQLWIACDVDGSGDIDIDEYKCMFRTMWEVLQDEVVDGGNVDRINALAETEFEKDCGAGAATLDEPRFKQSWFQLADTWSSAESTAEEYTSFLKEIAEPLRSASLGPRIGAAIAAAKQARRAAEAAQAALRLALRSVVDSTKRCLGLASFSNDNVGCNTCRAIVEALAVWSREIHLADSSAVPDLDFEHCRTCVIRHRRTVSKSGEGWSQSMPRQAKGKEGAKERLEEDEPWEERALPKCLTIRPPSKPAAARPSNTESPRVAARQLRDGAGAGDAEG